MTTYPAWTPASRPGIIPLHPLSFGTILGRSFTALRQNPKVLLGFALCVQAVAYLVVLVAVGAVAWASFSRLDTLAPGSEDYNAVMAGSIALTAIAGIVLGLAAGALGVIVQGVVVAEVAHAALAEKLTLGALWRRVKPVAWRLLGYSFLLVLATLALVTVGGVVHLRDRVGRAARRDRALRAARARRGAPHPVADRRSSCSRRRRSSSSTRRSAARSDDRGASPADGSGRRSASSSSSR